MDKPYEKPDKEFIRRTFDSISPRYDLLNQILSFGSADQWRKLAAIYLMSDLPMSADSILDVGVGTGDFLKWFLRRREQQVPASVPGAQVPGVKEKAWKRATIVDFASAMLEQSRKKLPPQVELLIADFHELPFEDSSFDLIVSAFTLRSVQHMPRFLSGIFRILKPGGRVGFLDLTRPRNWFHKLLFFPYLRIFLPVMGWLISGNQTAYQFLYQSVDGFQAPEETMRLMSEAGFKDCHSKSFSFGAATLIIATK